MTKTAHVLVAAGGTGGHLFPAIALADKMESEGFIVTFMTDSRGKTFGIDAEKFNVVTIEADHFVGGVFKKIGALFSNVKGFLKAFRVLWKTKPDVVIGFGGYASFPALVSAVLLKIPSIIHQADACLGRTNRLLAPYVTRIATSYETVKFLKPEWQQKVVLTGIPLRQEIESLYTQPYPQLEKDGIFQILVMGGSQGAHVFGQVVPEAVKYLPPDHQRRLVISQQCRPEYLKDVREAYKTSAASVELAHFFDDMPLRYRDAQLVIGRSGASSVNEIACAGRPAIFVPYPHAMDDHQTSNAEAAFDAGGAWIMPQTLFTAEKLAILLEEFFESSWKLADAAVNMHKLARPDATDHLISLVKSLMAFSQVELTTKGEAT
ncbi:UDP-N-acetylglucosamine--N-acetylmuramyl-(pentapeptide) pyrophosphoryl-undecaprenol N-acetylglucosamine transferase [Candidatus Bealeia paramacronuclearis]|uniref:UDP-N-acetylglucosamine--N-acetylmuramyl-(pentapeptide) pyrophosphoryl-undecaprenol N-acetylglucosamine transferase n=1 Tax=Candidatus Bealeia paramacronuclearis TaxID=1921001 RepID=A0ABZ2C4N3_9PROT|nr:UDP-N-acetylglucosamine--N-acetylmuramyl-(pentapeptide) pyrophosphoryl-undecaprenol N-acetylglucosamine transferase [Candidatus Bealeia paramacronuclearis]